MKEFYKKFFVLQLLNVVDSTTLLSSIWNKDMWELCHKEDNVFFMILMSIKKNFVSKPQPNPKLSGVRQVTIKKLRD